MAEQPDQILEREFEAIKTDLIKKYDELGMRASGNWARSLDVRVSGLTAKLLGPKYTEQLVFGRKPGKFPPIAAIERWIREKGLKPIEDNLKISSLAFLIARKISQEGTQYFQQGGTDLIDSVITPRRIQSIIGKVSVFFVNEFVLTITNQLKEISKEAA